MKIWLQYFLVMFCLGFPLATEAAKQPAKEVLQCAAFSPYVGEFNPDRGPHPTQASIDALLDQLIKETPFRCIMTYGVLNGLEYTFAAAKARQLKVIAILWLDSDPNVNSQSISAGIALAKTYPKTIIRLSCGSEVRTRHDYAQDAEILRCMSALREAKVTQPITSIDIWWEWCNRSQPCHSTNLGEQSDWIGVNVFPWWESKHSGLYPCVSAEQAADFHIARLEEIQKIYPGKEIILTEFGWPSGPEGAKETNKLTKQQCAVAGKKNQALVLRSTFKKLAKKGWSGTVFEAFAEHWKPSEEGDFGHFWGICQGEPPFRCADF